MPEVIRDRFVFTCDACGKTIAPEHQESLGAAWQEASRRGWRSKQIAWSKVEHVCPECGQKD
jgi:predicted RNA-binding Zn-ribbon protein involved in translation (DUF1610 family)